MHPVFGETTAGRGAEALRHFVLMMRENQILSAAMNVEINTEMLAAHGRAFDMPAGPAKSPGAVPARIIPERRFPQHKIGRVFLVGGNLHAGAGNHLVAVPVGEAAIVIPGRHIEQHMTVFLIGMTIGDQGRDDVDHLRDMFGRPRLDSRRQAAKVCGILAELGGGTFGQVADTFAVVAGAGVDLVFNVGDVPDIGHPVML